MKVKNRHILTKFIIIALMAVICLPCPIRQEIKQVLDIPVEQSDQLENLEKTAICQSVTIDENWHTSDQQTEVGCDAEKIPHIDVRIASDVGSIPLLSHPPVTPVPIYILHEQYLI